MCNTRAKKIHNSSKLKWQWCTWCKIKTLAILNFNVLALYTLWQYTSSRNEKQFGFKKRGTTCIYNLKIHVDV